jgi:hypothetical protein
MSEILEITAADLRPGDVWLGEGMGTELLVKETKPTDFIPTTPWLAGRSSKPTMMRHFAVWGTFTTPDGSFEGRWTLQADQPLEVRRD